MEFVTEKIAIIGGGFCGWSLAANLIYKAQKPLQIYLIEKGPHLAKGVAYSTKNAFHLLNVRAENMGAFADRPQHFFEWLNHNERLWREKHPGFQHLAIEPHSYLPRMLYGIYLEAIRQEAIQQALEKKISFQYLEKEVVDVTCNSGEVSLQFLDKSMLSADVAVLAIGVPPNKSFTKSNAECSHYYHSIWSESFDELCDRAQRLNSDTHIAIIGTGLTMLDALTSLVVKGFKGKISAISRSGIISKTHLPYVESWPNFIPWENPPTAALEVFRLVRWEIAKAEKAGKSWRSVIDALRKEMTRVWQSLSWLERKKAVAHLLKIWNPVRHRLPWNYATELQDYMNSGHFHLHKAIVKDTQPLNNHKIRLCLQSQDKTLSCIEADYVLNCSGPEMNVTKHPSALIQNLLKKEAIVPDPLNLGIQVDIHGKVKGKNQGRLFAVGQILFGERLETTAVPELRQQCAELADCLINNGDYCL
jgi:uncharacterized NAD(P)/FAD-binding protein YdhS